jgi:DNA-binding NarL/FixJ family response regulator
MILEPSSIFSDTLKAMIETTEPRAQVTAVAGPDQAMAVLHRAEVDAVFLDIAIPGTNGIHFIGTLRKLVPSACIVVLSSHDSAEYKEAALGKGADFFLTKTRSGGVRLLDVIHHAVRGNSHM